MIPTVCHTVWQKEGHDFQPDDHTVSLMSVATFNFVSPC